jgi:hypothetical protein
LVFYFLTLAPHDYVIYYQARGLSGHTSPRGECVCFVLEGSVPLEAKEEYLLHSWPDSKWAHFVHCEEIFYSELELLTPLWQDMLGLCCSVTGRIARRHYMLLGNCSQLLGNSSRWSDHESVLLGFVCTCSDKLKTALHNGCKALARIPTADHMGCAPRGGLAHKTKPCGARLCSAPPARYQEDILKILRNLIGYVWSLDSCNQLLLSGYLLDLTLLLGLYKTGREPLQTHVISYDS